MTAISTQKFRLSQTALFIAGFATSAEKNVYLGIGRPNAWPNDLIPPTPVDDVTNLNDCRNTLLALKKITESDVVNVIPRFNWDAQGYTVYVPYSNTDADLFKHPTSAEIAAASLLVDTRAGSFYCVTDELNVYKCLSNNSGAKSTVKPTGQSINSITTADGYVWKFMFSVKNSDVLKFLTNSWLPVRKLLSDDGTSQWDVQAGAVSGSIEIINVTNAGTGYNRIHTGNAQAGASGSITLAAGASAATNYYNGSSVYINSGTGAGQVKPISAYNGTTKVATITGTFSPAPDATSTYSVLPTITITGDGSGAVAKAEITSGTISKIIMNNIGSNYSYANVSIQTQDGTQALATAILSPQGGHGADAVSELGGTYVMINARLEFEEGNDFPIDNDYRRILIINNVRNAANAIATSSTLNATNAMTISGLSGTFTPDEILNFSGGGVAKYVGRVSTTLYYYQDVSTGFGTLTGTITGATSAATATASTLLGSEITRQSGDIVYIEQRRPVNRSANQLEDIKAIIKF